MPHGATAEGPDDTNDDTLLAAASQRIDQCCKLAASLYAESVKATTNITNSNDDDASHRRSTDMPHAVGVASPEPEPVDAGQAETLLMPRQRVHISGVERLLPRFVPCGDLVKALHEVEACRTDADELRAQLQAADETVAR